MNTFGENLRLTLFGESHGPAVGMTLDGLPAGITLDMEAIQTELDRRAPGGSELTSARQESDRPVFLSGLLSGRTTGAPLTAVFRNEDTQSEDYTPNLPRPSHSDLPAQIKYKGFADYRGGGCFSGRLTAPMVLAGAVCRQILAARKVEIKGELVRVGAAEGTELNFEMRKEILDARASGDSVGGTVECVATGLPAGVGELFFGGMESRISAMLFAIPGCKGVEFGDGFALSAMRGSAANDAICIERGRIYTETNHSGGLNGGLTNGMPVIVRAAFRPTPSIAREQKTVDLKTMENTTMRCRGRHDPCIALRAVPVVEACVAFCLLDAMG